MKYIYAIILIVFQALHLNAQEKHKSEVYFAIELCTDTTLSSCWIYTDQEYFFNGVWEFDIKTNQVLYDSGYFLFQYAVLYYSDYYPIEVDSIKKSLNIKDYVDFDIEVYLDAVYNKSKDSIYNSINYPRFHSNFYDTIKVVANQNRMNVKSDILDKKLNNFIIQRKIHKLYDYRPKHKKLKYNSHKTLLVFKATLSYYENVRFLFRDFYFEDEKISLKTKKVPIHFISKIELLDFER